MTDQSLEVESQDPNLISFGKSVLINLNSKTVFKRKKHLQDGVGDGARPQPWDKVTIQTNDREEAVEVLSEYGKTKGAIKNFEKPVLQGPHPHNGIVELENGTRYELSFNKDHTRLKIGSLDGLAIKYDVHQVFDAFHPGKVIEIQYLPGSVGGNCFRMISVIEEGFKAGIDLKIKRPNKN